MTTAERTSLHRPTLQDDHNAPGYATTSLWIDFLLQRKHPHEVRLTVPTSTNAQEIKVDGDLLAAYRTESPDDDDTRPALHDFVWDIGDGLVRVEEIYNHQLRLRVVVDGDFNRANSVLDGLRQQIKVRRKQKSNEVKIRFWRMTVHGGASFTRNIAAPTWRSIERNYSNKTSLQLAQLMKVRPKQIGTGKVILLHGPAGTGKTTAIRALAREWRRWCDFAYAVDPERVFGQGDYLTTLISNGDDDDDYMASSETPTTRKWRLLIIEDAEEFLVPDAKHEVGQAVSRLLNVGDGILGQGLQLLVMLTTNVPVEKLSPAITRPGRCLANIEVPAIPKSEASEWLGRSVQKDTTLAELWEMAHPSQIGTGLSLVHGSGQYL